MLRFARTADAIAATTSKLAKTAIVADYFRSLPQNQAAIAAIFFPDALLPPTTKPLSKSAALSSGAPSQSFQVNPSINSPNSTDVTATPERWLPPPFLKDRKQCFL